MNDPRSTDFVTDQGDGSLVFLLETSFAVGKVIGRGHTVGSVGALVRVVVRGEREVRVEEVGVEIPDKVEDGDQSRDGLTALLVQYDCINAKKRQDEASPMID